MMKHRERVLAALDHKEPDRVPIDLWGSASRICNDLYFRIVEYLGLDGYGDYERASRCSDYVDYRISDIVDADFRHINIGKPKYFCRNRRNDEKKQNSNIFNIIHPYLHYKKYCQ